VEFKDSGSKFYANFKGKRGISRVNMVFRANFTGISRQLILTVFFVKHRESYTSNSIDCCLEHDEPYEHGQTWNLSRSNIVFDKCKVKLQH
jgi:hypothetical protein